MGILGWDELLPVLMFNQWDIPLAVTRPQPPASELGRLRKRDRVLRAGKDLVRRVSWGMQSAASSVDCAISMHHIHP